MVHSIAVVAAVAVVHSIATLVHGQLGLAIGLIVRGELSVSLMHQLPQKSHPNEELQLERDQLKHELSLELPKLRIRERV